MRSHPRPGLPVIAALVVGASLGAAQAPINDNCANVFNLPVPFTIVWNNIGATLESGSGACVPIGADVWFRIVAPFSGTAIASTCSLLSPGSANFDTVITIRQDYACGFNTVLGCSDDAPNCSLASHCTAPVTIGQSYMIQVGGYNGAMGNFNLYVNVTPQVPSNDHCSAAIAVIANSYASAETFGATTGPEPTASCTATYNDVWYSFVAPTSGQYTASTCYAPNLSMNTVAAVWQGSCGNLTEVACKDNGCGGTSGGSMVTWCAVAGTSYFISVGSTGNYGGTFSMIINPSSNPPMELAFFNAGSGSLGFSVRNGPLGGTEFTAITANQGAYPNAWFSGIDPGIPELLNEWSTGYPFSAPLSPLCGSVVVGPFFGLPNGLTVYAVSLGFAPGAMDHPIKFSNPASATIP
jgi:hypothetical protein